jgi:hypothetical protein
MADTKISDLNAATSIADADLLTIVQSGSNKKITGETFRSVMGYIQKKVTVSSAQLLTLGTVPFTIIAAPGANKYLAIHSVYVSYNFGTTAYDYSSIESPYFYFNANGAGFIIEYSVMNGGADFIAKLLDENNGTPRLQYCYSNRALTLGTIAGTDPSQGDGDLDVVVYYSIEDVNT